MWRNFIFLFSKLNKLSSCNIPFDFSHNFTTFSEWRLVIVIRSFHFYFTSVKTCSFLTLLRKSHLSVFWHWFHSRHSDPYTTVYFSIFISYFGLFMFLSFLHLFKFTHNWLWDYYKYPNFYLHLNFMYCCCRVLYLLSSYLNFTTVWKLNKLFTIFIVIENYSVITYNISYTIDSYILMVGLPSTFFYELIKSFPVLSLLFPCILSILFIFCLFN